MWYGNMTPELEKLYDEYYNVFGGDPDEYDELEYGANEYNDYIKDIKTSIRLKRELPSINE